jgi:hypothetical protein
MLMTKAVQYILNNRGVRMPGALPSTVVYEKGEQIQIPMGGDTVTVVVEDIKESTEVINAATQKDVITLYLRTLETPPAATTS